MKSCYTLIFLSIGTSFNMEKPPVKDKSEIASNKSDKHVHGSHVKYKSGSKIITHPSKPASCKGALVRSTTQRLRQDLIDAVKQGEYDRVKSLLAGNASVNPLVSDETSETPLFAAIEAEKYHDKILAKLLEHHADPDQKVRGIAPLTQALKLKREKAALRLLYAHAKTSEDIHLSQEFLSRELFYEIEKKRLDRIKILISLNAPINIQIKSDNGEKDTPLLAAIDVPEKYSKDVFEEVAAIADVNLCAADKGLSPLQKAVLWNNEEAALFLVVRDANLEHSMPLYQKTSFSILQLAQQMNMNELVTTIKSLELSRSNPTEKLKERIDKDKLVAELTRQSTPRRTTSQRAAVPKP